jgi:hypothetical protein
MEWQAVGSGLPSLSSFLDWASPLRVSRFNFCASQEQARAALSTAIDIYREMKMTFWVPETEAALAEVEGKA